MHSLRLPSRMFPRCSSSISPAPLRQLSPSLPAVRMASPPFGTPSNPLVVMDPLNGIPPESSPGCSSSNQSYSPPLTVGGASQRR